MSAYAPLFLIAAWFATIIVLAMVSAERDRLRAECNLRCSRCREIRAESTETER